MTKQSWTVWQLASEDEYGNSLEDPGVIITTADGETEITGLIHDPTHAPVIAASPELLDALKDALEALEGFLPEDYSNDTEPDQDMRAALKARTAIAKAEGGAASVCGDHRQPIGQDRAKRGQGAMTAARKPKAASAIWP